MKLNWTIVNAIFRRDIARYFTSPTGYVFITLFIFISAIGAFWQADFFRENLANLNQLNAWFPYLLILFVPALSMGIWSDEINGGTDELLLTLPATDFEVTLGKYLAALGIYTASIVLSLSHVVVLFWLGAPDLGLMLANYMGYWLFGGALIAVGMLASLLTPNSTVAFILGSVFTAILMFLPEIFGVFGPDTERLLYEVGLVSHFQDFARGVVTFSGLLYFLLVAALFLYLNVAILGRRHWQAKKEGSGMLLHYIVRSAAIALALVCLTTIVGRAGMRLDVTAEGLHSLSDQTYSLIDQLDSDRPVFVQAFVSPQVPAEFVQTRENLISFLREIDAEAGGKVQVVVYDTEPYTEEAREAREKFNILPREISDPSNARAGSMQVFLGLAYTCGAEEEVVPFFDRGLPVEYELARSIRVVARTQRKKLGVVKTEAKVFGGFDFQAMSSNPPWEMVEELRKQYDLVEIDPANPITEDLDGLLAVLPSSLGQPAIDNVKAYIEQGNPAVLLVDPLPLVNPALAPLEQPGGQQNPFQQRQGPPPTPKGDIQTMLNSLGVSWNSGQIIWDTYNPHPQLQNVPAEFVFIGPGSGNENSVSPASVASSGLQELVLLYPGSIFPSPGSSFNFQPLLETGYTSGAHNYNQVMMRTFFGSQINPNLPHNNPTGTAFTVAAHVTSGKAAADDEESDDDEAASAADPGMNLVVISDIDFVSEQLFRLRRMGIEGLNFDNVTFFLNCVDLVMGDDSFIDLRKKRVKHRTLELVENQKSDFVEASIEREREAEAAAQTKLNQAQAELDRKIDEVRTRSDLDEQAKQIMARNIQEVENRKFEVAKERIDQEKEATIAEAKEDMESQILDIINIIKYIAILIPPIPVLVIGVVIFVRRQRREREGAAMARRLRG